MKTFNRFILLLILAGVVQTAPAQDNGQADLRKKLMGSMPDSERVNTLNALSRSYFNDNPDSSVIIAMSSRDLAEKIGYRPGQALALKNMGIGYYWLGKNLDAVKSAQLAMAVYESIGDTKGVANMLSNQGAVYFNQGDDAKSLELHLQSLKLSEKLNDTLRILTSLTNIGAVYLNKTATYQKALEFFLRSYNMSLAIKDQYSIGTSTANLGETYFKIGDDEKALFYLTESVKAYAGTEDLPYPMNYIGRIYTREKKYDKAIETHREAYNIASKLGSRLDMTQSLVAMAQAYFAKGDIRSAIATYKQSLEHSVPLNNLSAMIDAYGGLSGAYSNLHDYANAYGYDQLLLSAKDSMYNIDTDKKLATLSFTRDLEMKESEISLLSKDKLIQQQQITRQKLVRNGFIGGFAIVLVFASLFLKQRIRIAKEKKRSDDLMLNILPSDTAEELKATGTAKTKSFDSVSVLFTDFKNFTQASELLTPEELVAEINYCYSEFDRIVTRYGVEKIKTIGDSYMCAAGLPVENDTHPIDIISAGLEMVEFIEKNKRDRIAKGQPYFELRIGVHSGPVVAGIVGIKKFAYDIWGDTVNTASRMESSGYPGKVNISGTTYELVKDKFLCDHRGKIEAKNKGQIDMYFVEGISLKVIQENRYHLL
ncbi:MAG: tetratricopeptide repeat protein [Chitinophagaceae bacterium]|nr:MAG: tetratricopeptide repeat protein [Chitinophagaceae bacterium]